MSTSFSETGDGALDARVRAVHRRFPTGVTIVTTCVGEQPFGLAVNAFSSVSLTPPRVLVCVARSSKTHPRLLEGEHLGVNILAADQAAIAAVFATSGGDKFASLSWHAGASGVPLLDGVAASFEVQVTERIPAHTHTIFLGDVVNASAHDRAPLVYLAGGLFDGGRLESAV